MVQLKFVPGNQKLKNWKLGQKSRFNKVMVFEETRSKFGVLELKRQWNWKLGILPQFRDWRQQTEKTGKLRFWHCNWAVVSQFA
jgi:hypothetical protein